MTLKRLLLSIAIITGTQHTLADVRIAVISDCHVVSPMHVSQLGAPHGKMDAQSYQLLQAALDSIKAGKPDLLLISGDLTYNGEKAGHQAVSTLLHNVSTAGIRVLVVPGNHDILNPHHLGDEETTPQDFSTIYAGFIGDIRHTGTLSWAQRIGSDMAVIGLDANIYSTGRYVSDGCITTSHLQWLAHTAHTLRSEGRTIIALVHQQLLEHFNNQARLLPGTLYNVRYQTLDSNLRPVTPTEVRQAFAEAGIHYVLSGHSHVHDISRAQLSVNGTPWDIWDISTGGLTTYPSYIRTIQVDTKTQDVSITSKTITIEATATGPDGKSYTDTHDYGLSLLKEQALKQIRTSLNHMLGNTLATMALYILGEDLIQAVMAFTHGDEASHGGSAIYANIRQKTEDIRHDIKDRLLEALHSMMLDYNGTDTTDTTPDCTVTLQPT